MRGPRPVSWGLNGSRGDDVADGAADGGVMTPPDAAPSAGSWAHDALSAPVAFEHTPAVRDAGRMSEDADRIEIVDVPERERFELRDAGRVIGLASYVVVAGVGRRRAIARPCRLLPHRGRRVRGPGPRRPSRRSGARRLGGGRAGHRRALPLHLPLPASAPGAVCRPRRRAHARGSAGGRGGGRTRRAGRSELTGSPLALAGPRSNQRDRPRSVSACRSTGWPPWRRRPTGRRAGPRHSRRGPSPCRRSR